MLHRCLLFSSLLLLISPKTEMVCRIRVFIAAQTVLSMWRINSKHFKHVQIYFIRNNIITAVKFYFSNIAVKQQF